MPDGAINRIYWRRNCYQYKSTDLDRAHGMLAWVKLSSDWEQALAQYHALSRVSKPDAKTLQWLLEWYLVEITPELRARTRLDKRQHVRQITSRIGSLQLDSVCPPDIQRYVFARAKESRHQAKQELSTLSQAFRWGRRFGLVDGNPASDIATPRISHRQRYVTDAELTLFCDVNSGWGRAVAMLGYGTGQRLSDLLSLRFSEPALRLMASKNQRRAEIVLTDQLRALIDLLRSGIQPGELILVNRRNEPFNRSSFHQRWQLCMRRFEAAGGDRFHFHDLKAKFVTDSEKRGLDPQTQALHDHPRTTQIYLRNRGITRVTSMV